MRFISLILTIISFTAVLSAELCAGKTGASMRTCLHDAYKCSSVRSMSYKDARVYIYGDLDNVDDSLDLVYSDLSVYWPHGHPSTDYSKLVNLEHVVPQSFFGKKSPMVSDMHHMRAAYNRANSIRSSYPFCEATSPAKVKTWIHLQVEQSAIPDGDLGNWSKLVKNSAGTCFEPRDVVKGEIARSVLYFFTTYPSYIQQLARTAQSVETLVRWSETYPPTPAEVQRSKLIAQKQNGVGNMYIEHPELVRVAYQDLF